MMDSIIDISINNAPVAELLALDEDLKTTYDFINKSLKPIDRKAIVTDFKARI